MEVRKQMVELSWLHRPSTRMKIHSGRWPTCLPDGDCAVKPCMRGENQVMCIGSVHAPCASPPFKAPVLPPPLLATPSNPTQLYSP